MTAWGAQGKPAGVPRGGARSAGHPGSLVSAA